MKKTTIIAIVLVCVVALGGGAAYAAGQIAKSNAIGDETALRLAYADANVSPAEAKLIESEFDLEKGKFVYELEFTANGIKYEYKIDSSNGKILEREQEGIPGYEKDKETASGEPSVTPSNPSEQQNPNEVNVIGVEKAKGIALKSAGLSENAVVFEKAKLEKEDGKLIYDIEFYVKGRAEYEYEIDAVSGAILEKNYEAWDEEDTVKKASANGTKEQKTPVKEVKPEEKDTGKQTTDTKQNAGTTQKEETASSGKTTSTEKKASTITVEEAKSIALKHAGLSKGNVVFSKAKLDREDGALVYDIEFYVKGKAEYEYEIHAETGKIMDVDVGRWEADDDDDEDWDD